MGDHSTPSGGVLGHAAVITTTDYRQLYTLKAHEPLADIIVRARVNATSLSVAEEFI